MAKRGVAGLKALAEQQLAQVPGSATAKRSPRGRQLDGVGFVWDASAEKQKSNDAVWETSFAALKQCAPRFHCG